MKTAPARRYRASPKREATKQQNRAAIEAAAWQVFYNYYRTKEASFEVLSQNVLERIRSESRAARAKAESLEEFLSLSYESYLHLLQSIDGALSFIDRNQHHIRSQIYRSSAVSGLSADLAEDLRRFVPPGAMSPRDRVLVSNIIIAAGAEAIFQVGRKRQTMTHVREFLPNFILKGLRGVAVA